MYTTIDSMSLLIDIKKIKFKCPELKAMANNHSCHLYTVDAEPKYIRTQRMTASSTIRESKHQNYSIYYKLESPSTGIRKNEQVLNITLNAKMLTTDYLMGISQSNIETIYSAVISDNKIDVSYSDFLQSKVMILDIKADRPYRENEIFHELTQGFIEALKPEYNQTNNLATRKNTKTHQAFYVGTKDRKDTKFPLFKIYNKQIELEHQSIDFHSNCLNSAQISSPIRCEISLYGAKQMKQYNLLEKHQSNTLETILAQVSSNGHEAIVKIMDKYFLRKPSSKITLDNSSIDKDVIKITNYVRLSILANIPQAQIIQDAPTHFLVGLNKQSKYKKLAEQIYFYQMAQNKAPTSEDLYEVLFGDIVKQPLSDGKN